MCIRDRKWDTIMIIPTTIQNKKITPQNLMTTMSTKGPISKFIEKHYLHFNSAALVDAAKGYETHLL